MIRPQTNARGSRPRPDRRSPVGVGSAGCAIHGNHLRRGASRSVEDREDIPRRGFWGTMACKPSAWARARSRCPNLHGDHDLRQPGRRGHVASASSTCRFDAGINFFDTAENYPVPPKRGMGRPHRGDRRPLDEDQAPRRPDHRHQGLRPQPRLDQGLAARRHDRARPPQHRPRASRPA